MGNLKLYSYASHLAGNSVEMLASIHGKIPYEIKIADYGKWDWAMKVNWELSVAQSNPDQYIIFVDLWDSLFVGDAKEMEEQLRVLPAMTQSSRVCWPHAWKEEWYRKRVDHNSPWKYINGAGVMGRGREIAEAIRYGMAYFPIMPSRRDTNLHDYLTNDNDARFWTDVYLAGMIQNDYNCMFVQQMVGVKDGELGWKDGRIHNLITNTRPHFLHASAHTWNMIPDYVVRSATNAG